MIESIHDFWYMWLILIVLIAVTVFAAVKASKAVKKRNSIMRKQREELERLKFLKEKYSRLTADLARESEAKELAEGVTAVLQLELEKSVNPDSEFLHAAKWRREVYALYYFDEDCARSLSFFFRHNERPLPDEALDGLASVNIPRIRDISLAMYAMYDDKNENVSLDNARVEELDKKFNAVYDRDAFFESIKQYIIDNIEY